MAYWLAKSRLAHIQCHPWLALLQRALPHLSASVLTSAQLTPWRCKSAMVTVYRGHHQTLFFLPGINSLFIMCIRIIRNNSSVGGCAQAEARTSAITLYCTWCLSALTTVSHGQVYLKGHILPKFSAPSSGKTLCRMWKRIGGAEMIWTSNTMPSLVGLWHCIPPPRGEKV